MVFHEITFLKCFVMSVFVGWTLREMKLCCLIKLCEHNAFPGSFIGFHPRTGD